ncbi:hypothetical protein phiIBB-PF7Ap42 [Pseudomonas phage phiIBB-PF7A]|uniref:Uncharacterized protein n=1 Tax=Pseudomonas phage phiIBB-PF7A TaxID=942165 RepID=E9KII2_9CAUD|nr:hypothetical protein phiIBB-PF7Ap42 [Pseudomonas phage phiIBB-PF7A]ADV35707.1 hypothetical protein phiIBB-PF7Ap42 [Pseudomonas phage phiIBB-PF7A]
MARLDMHVTGLEYDLSLEENAQGQQGFTVTYGAQVNHYERFDEAFMDFNESLSHALALQGL